MIPLIFASCSVFADGSNLVSRVHVDAYAEFASAYKTRGVVIDSRPLLSESADVLFDLSPFGFIGGTVWSGSAVSDHGQSYNRRNAFNETYLAVYGGYDLELAEDWTLRTAFGRGWDMLPGYDDELCRGFYEWLVMQSLENPYVTPYYLLRRSFQRARGCYWEVGLKRDFALTDQLVLTVNLFSELSDGRQPESAYGPDPYSETGEERYPRGFLALDADVRLAYYLTEWMSVYVYVHQFDVVSGELRDAIDWYHDTYDMPEMKKDLTYGGVGLRIRF